MLVPAIYFNEKVRIAYASQIIAPKSKYLFFNNYTSYVVDIETTEKNKVQYISLDREEISAYFEAKIDLINLLATDFFIFSFSKHITMTIIRDLLDLLFLLLITRNYRKILFFIVGDNPFRDLIQKHFLNKSTLVSELGKISKYKKIQDNEYHDAYFYEITQESFKDYIVSHPSYFSHSQYIKHTNFS